MLLHETRTAHFGAGAPRQKKKKAICERAIQLCDADNVVTLDSSQTLATWSNSI